MVLRNLLDNFLLHLDTINCTLSLIILPLHLPLTIGHHLIVSHHQILHGVQEGLELQLNCLNYLFLSLEKPLIAQFLNYLILQILDHLLIKARLPLRQLRNNL